MRIKNTDQDEIPVTAQTSGAASNTQLEKGAQVTLKSATLYHVVDPGELEILEELKHYIIRPKTKEPLREDILLHGIKDPLKVWQYKDENGKIHLVLYDGFTRHEIATEHPEKRFKLPILISTEFKSLDEVKYEMDRIQASLRRNLTDIQKKYTIGRSYNNIKKDNVMAMVSARAARTGNKTDMVSESDQITRSLNIVGDEYGEAKTTVQRSYDLYRGLNVIEPKNRVLFEAILNQEVKINYSDLELMGRSEDFAPTALDSVEDLKAYVTGLKDDANEKKSPNKAKGGFEKVKKSIDSKVAVLVKNILKEKSKGKETFSDQVEEKREELIELIRTLGKE